MALRAAPTHLTVIDGGSPLMRIEEAHIEAIAFCDEVEWAAAEIVNAIVGLPVPSMKAINEATRMAHRASAARAELLALTGQPEPAA